MKDDNKSNDSNHIDIPSFLVPPEENEDSFGKETRFLLDLSLLEAADEESKREEETGKKESRSPFHVFCMILMSLSIIGLVIAAIVLSLRYP